MEAWVRVADLTQTNRLIAGSTDTGLLLSFDAALGLFASANNGTRLTTAYMPSSTNEWVNCAVVNVAEDIRFYVNGALLSSSNISAVRPNFWSPYFRWNLGVNNDQVAGFKGWIDEYRMFSFIAGQFCTNDLLYNVAQGKPGFAGIPTWNTVCQDGTNVMVVAGDTLNLLCTTKGAAPISYFWETNGVLASTNQVLSFTNATVGLSGSYILVASNSFGATTSAAVQVNVRSLIVPTQGTTPNTGQALMMSRKYGMFMHYGPQTFDLLANQYGLVENYHYSPPSISIYRPTQLDPAQWIDTAWNAGFRYVVLVAKHSSGFCLWPTATTRYNVAYSPVTNDVVGAVAAASANRGLGFGVYFSLWDQTFYGETTGPMYGRPYDSGFFNVITNQLTELMSNYGPICEVWFDGQWEASRNPYFWHAAEIYDLVKRLQPNCSVNWNWGVTKLNNLPTSTGLIYSATPAQMADGDPIEFWPSDGRTADPVLPANPDPKQFSNPNIAGSSYYMPFEAPMTIQNNGAWFWHFETGDVGTMAPSFIAAYYTYCIAQNDAFLLNVPPNTNGVISTAYSNALMSAAAAIGITPVLVPAAISGPLTNQTIECGSNITIAVTASGTHPLRIQWSFDGTPIPGATNSSLSLTNIHLPDHTVTLVVTNLYGSLASNVVLTVHDTIAPRITLNGSNPLIIELGAGFTDPGATADDTCASSVSVVASGAVNTDAVGTNTVVYTADDGNGNTNTALRTVIVRDTTPPTILWSFTNLVLMADTNCGALMPDVTGTNYILATDLSGPLTITQIPTNQAPLLLGTNLVVITVSDAYNNAADSTNAVIVRNQTLPVITLNGSNPLFIELGAGFTDPGATADDTCVGSVSVIASGAVNTDAVGTNSVVYTADDGNGNTNTALRTVIVRDTTPPAILWSFTNLVLMADTNCGALMPDVTGTNYILATDLSGPLTITQIPTNQAPLLLGTNLVVITVSDAYNNAADSTNAIVSQDQSPPVILSQPQSRTNLVGATADFSVSASSCTPLAYQWFFNGGVLTNQTNNTLMIVSTGPANAGDYTALVTASGGSTTSAVATLTVSATPIITSVDGNPDGSFSLNLAGGAGCTYVFETTTNLDSLGIWLPVATNTVGSNGLWQFNDAQATNFSQRFYRSKLVP